MKAPTVSDAARYLPVAASTRFGGWAQTPGHVVVQPVDHPSQDTRAVLGDDLGGEVRVGVARIDTDIERDELHAPPDPLIGPVDAWTMVGVQPQGMAYTHPTTRAGLFRRRFAHSGELPQAAWLDEAQVKELTGADRISARRMREDEWEFTPGRVGAGVVNANAFTMLNIT